MSKAVRAVKLAVCQGGGLQLPATSKFLAKSPLDEEEKAGKVDVGFLFPNGPERRVKSKVGDGSQGNWSALEVSLASGSSNASSFTRKAASSESGAQESDWHEIPVARMTPELQKDLRVIENRQHLDPKRFYKSSGTGRKKGELPNRVHVGTVMVGAHEFYSSRLTRRERRRSVLDEVLSDERVMNYTKNKFKTLQQAKQINKRVIDPAARRKRRRGRWQ